MILLMADSTGMCDPTENPNCCGDPYNAGDSGNFSKDGYDRRYLEVREHRADTQFQRALEG